MMQVKNIDSLNYFTEKFGIIDPQQEYEGYVTKPTFLAEFNNATVHPLPFLMSEHGQFITENIWPLLWKQKNKPQNHGIFKQWADNIEINFNPINHNFTEENRYVWLAIDKSSCNNPWHIWMDLIAKMRLLEKKLARKYNEFVYIIPNESKYFKKIVNEIDPSIKFYFMKPNDVWRFKHIYAPSMVNHDDGVVVPQSVSWIRSRFLRNKNLDQNRKIFIDRSGSRQLSNKEEIFARLKGWEILDLDKMTLIDQINAFQQATDVIATHGAGLVNLLWSRPGTKVLEIVHKFSAKKVYPNLSYLLGLDHKVLMGEAVPIEKTTHEKKFKRLNDYNDIRLDSSILVRNL